MRLLAVIPARGGSKRLPGKNILSLAGFPMIQWTINFAQHSRLFEKVIVSTDSENIAEIARSAGAYAPWLRPDKLAMDDTKTWEVCLHALDWYEREKNRVDGIVTLQPTSPFRKFAFIEEAVSLFEKHEGQSVISVRREILRLDWALKSKMNYELLEIHGYPRIPRKLSETQLVVPSGNLYLTSPKTLRDRRSLLSENSLAIMADSRFEEIDIDIVQDFEIAETIAKAVMLGMTTDIVKPGTNF